MQSSKKITKGFIADFVSDSTQTALDLKANDVDVLHVTGNETKSGNLTLSNNLILGGTLNISGNIISTAGITLSGNISSTGNITTSGNIITSGTLTLSNLNSSSGIDKLGVNTSGQVVKAPDTLRVPVRNITGSTINKGSVVYVNGAQGNKATIALASANGIAIEPVGIGIVENNINNNSDGYMVVAGEISNLNTNAFANGNKLFISPTTPGALTNVLPTGVNRVVLVGTVTNAHNTQGEIMINVVYGFKLDVLSDVLITAPANNNLLVYETATTSWKNKSAATIGLALDANVLHNTGNETKAGVLTLLNNLVANDKILIGTATDNGVDKLQVNGSILATSIKKVGGTAIQPLMADGNTNYSIQNNLLVDGTGFKLSTVDAVNDEFDYVQSTGVLHGGILSINADPTKFNLSAGVGYIVNSTNLANVTRTRVSWNAFTAQTVTNLGSQLVTYVSIDSSGNIFQQATFPTVAQRRARMIIGRLNHSNLTNITFTDTFPDMLQGPMEQYFDLTNALGPFSISGNLITANGANLSINKSVGESYNASFNYAIDNQSPNNISHPSLTLVSFRHQNQNSTDGSNITVIDPTNYDVGGVTTTVPNPTSTATAMRVYLFPSNVVRVQRGQAIYSNLATAVSSYKNEPYIENPSNTGVAIWIATIIVQKNCTSLQDTTTSRIIIEPKFGGSSGAAGVTTASLQSAYNNSVNPEILTNSILGALSVRRGSGSDADNVFEVQNGTGSNVFYITALGQAVTNNLFSIGTINIGGFTVGTLPSGNIGDIAYVVDASSPAYNTPVSGGGTDVVKVFFNGTNWVT